MASCCDGETASGEALLKQAASHPDDRGESWFALGLLQLAQEDHDGARDAFLKAVRTCFAPRSAPAEAAICLWDPSTNRYAIIEVFYSDFQHAFCCFPILRKVSPVEYQCYEYCMARACNYLRSSPALAEMLELDRQLNGATFWYHVNMGHHHWLHNQRDSADPHFRQARKIAVRTGLRPYHFNCGTMVWLPRHETEALHAGRGPLILRCRPPTGGINFMADQICGLIWLSWSAAIVAISSISRTFYCRRSRRRGRAMRARASQFIAMWPIRSRTKQISLSSAWVI